LFVNYHAPHIFAAMQQGDGSGVGGLIQRYAKEMVMRLLLIVLGVAAVMAAPGSSAQAQNYPWCAQYGGGNGGRNCGFTTFAQCQADVSGIGGFCEPNTTYVPLLAPASHRAAKRHAQ
jgi:hypothetical protein